MIRPMRLAFPVLCVLTATATARAQSSPAPQAAERAGQAAVAAPAVAAPAVAAAPVRQEESAAAAARHAGPVAARAAVGVRAPRAEAALPAPAPLPQGGGMRRYEAMMIVGVAGFIAGALIGDTPGTIIMVGSAGIGLYGLYKYLE